ncbi:MAG: lactate utilization protein [Pseudomonadota bacterium]
MEKTTGEMMRDTILNNIRKSLGREAVKTLEESLAAHTVQPAFGETLIYKFIKQLTKVSGTFESILNSKEIPFAVLEFLQKHNLPQEIVIDSCLKSLPWPNKLHLAYRAAQAEDMVSLSCGFAGIAETGSLVLLSSPGSPTTLNFLPDNHIVVLHKDNLVAHIEDVWARIGTMPRSVNIITGPSRTADIEQTIQLGAHGPRRLHLLLVK